MALKRRPLWQAALGSAVAGAALSYLGTMIAFGLPGVAFAMVTLPLIGLVWPAEELLPGESFWTFFLLISAWWGLSVPLAWLGTRRWAGWRRGLAFLGAMALGGVVTTVAVYAVVILPLRGA